MLLLHSEEDLRCPIEQAEDLFTRLAMFERGVELVRVSGEGHELTRSGAPDHRVARFELLLEFFGRHLVGHLDRGWARGADRPDARSAIGAGSVAVVGHRVGVVDVGVDAVGGEVQPAPLRR